MAKLMCLKKYVLYFLVFSLYLFYQNKIYMLFTKLEGRTGELLPEIITVRTEAEGPGPTPTDRWPRFVRSRLRTTFSQYRPTYVWQINYLFSSLFVYIFTFYECFSLFRVVLAYEVRYSKSHDRSSANQNASFHRNASFHPYMGKIIITCYFVIFHF